MAQFVPVTIFIHERDGAWVGERLKGSEGVNTTRPDFTICGQPLAPSRKGVRPRP